MSWELLRKDGIQQYKKRKYAEAAVLFTKAIEQGGQKEYTLYDARAATNEQLGDIKHGLLDAKQVIDLAPAQWQGYCRAARLFFRANRFEEAAKMADRAIARLSVGDTSRRVEMVNLKQSALDERRRTQDHTARLPVELLGEVFRFVVDADFALLLPILTVCTRWRGVAEANPSLWTVLRLDNRKPTWKLKRWITRSRNRIRELRFGPALGNKLDWSFDALADLDWERMRILRIACWRAATFLERIGRSHILANLLELEVIDETPSAYCSGLLANEASSLRSLKLRSLAIPQSLEDGLRALRGLEHLHLDSPISPVHILPDMCDSALQTLVVECAMRPLTNLPLPDEGSVRVLPALTRLELAGPVGIDWLIRALDIRAVQRLSITREVVELTVPLFHLASLSSASLKLTHIAIDRCSFAAPALVHLLAVSPSLQSLELRSIADVANTVLEHLEAPRPGKRTRSDRLICPKLRRVVVVNCPDVKTGPVLRMVGSRLPRGTATSGAQTPGDTVVQAASGSLPQTPSNALARKISDSLARASSNSLAQAPRDFRTKEPSSEGGEAGQESEGDVAEPVVEKIRELVLDGCPEIEAEHLPWLKERVRHVSCVYMLKKVAAWKR